MEYDAVIVAGLVAPAPDAVPALDAKAGDAAAVPNTVGDPRITLMLGELYRHGKPIGSLTGGDPVLAAADLSTSMPGVVRGEAADVVSKITTLLGQHRVWERFAPIPATGKQP